MKPSQGSTRYRSVVKNTRPGILKDGCLLINPLIGFDANNIIITVTITAVYIIHNSCTIPTAVMMESTENTRSRIMISESNLLKTTCSGHIWKVRTGSFSLINLLGAFINKKDHRLWGSVLYRRNRSQKKKIEFYPVSVSRRSKQAKPISWS